MRKKVLIRGPVLSRSGYGEQSRFALRALRKHEDKFDLYLINTQWGGTGWLADDNEERKYIDFLLQKTYHFTQHKGQLDASLQVTIPNEWEKIAPYNVGYTAGIETTKVAPAWIEKSQEMDKIIVTSNHAKQSLVNTTYDIKNQQTSEIVGKAKVTTPVEPVGYPVKLTKKKSVKLDLETDFNFLAVSQWGPRKNIGSTVEWFVQNFKDNPNVGLVLKGFLKNNCTMDKLHSESALRASIPADAKCKVYLLHGEMTDEEMIGLYSHPKVKCLISLTHGEGWGLPLFEASYTGLPILTTNWSGQTDFLNAPVKVRKKGKKNKYETIMKPHFAEVDYTLAQIQKEAVWDGVLQADSMWCYAEEESYKRALNSVYKDYDKYKDLAKKLKAHVRKQFEQEKQLDKFAREFMPSAFENKSEEEQRLVVNFT